MVLHSNMFPHPAFPPGVTVEMESGARRNGGRLDVSFLMLADMEKIVVPAPTRSSRRDNLWKTSCFEMFVRAKAADAYLEYNFSPSTNWAAYSFGDYRADMSELDCAPPRIDRDRFANTLRVGASVELPDGFEKDLRIGLCVVVEETDGTKSYWALHHPDADKPDFHHPASFTLELPPPGA